MNATPLCGECDNGWITDDDGNLIERCPCRYESRSGQQARDDGITATTDANRSAMTAALRIIRDTAMAKPVFSSNDTRRDEFSRRCAGNAIG